MTKREETLEAVCMEIYRKLYNIATPPANIDNLIKSGETKKANWFYKYYLEEDKLELIIEQVCKKHKLKKWEGKKIRFAILLGASPTSCRERWLKERNEKEKL